MTLTLELDPETEARLRRNADLLGVPAENLVVEYLRDRLFVATGKKGFRSAAEVEAFSRKFSAGSENIPILPPEANKREFYYEDHR